MTENNIAFMKGEENKFNIKPEGNWYSCFADRQVLDNFCRSLPAGNNLEEAIFERAAFAIRNGIGQEAPPTERIHIPDAMFDPNLSPK